MKAIILAGGQGTRLKDVIKHLPKPMAPVCGRPFIEYLVFQLRRHGVKEIIMATGCMKEAIRSYFKDGREMGVKISYSEEDRPLGTAGAIRKAAGLTADRELLIMNGDSFLDVDLKALAAFQRDKKGAAALCAVHMEDAGRYGRVERDGRCRVISFIEKGGSTPGLINGGVLMLRRDALNGIGMGAFSFEREVLPGLVDKGLYAMEVEGFFVDIGVPESYKGLLQDPGKLLAAAGLDAQKC